MRTLTLFLHLSFFHFSLQAEAFTPPTFVKTDLVKQIILISDVDGVVRNGIENVADPRVLEAVSALLSHENVHVAFISGTAVETDETTESWRKGNVPLKKVFGSVFQKEISEKRVCIYGISGGHRMTPEGKLEVLDEYSLKTSFALCSLLTQSFLHAVHSRGDLREQGIAAKLSKELQEIVLQNLTQSTHLTANEFKPIISSIHDCLDPEFRLINNGGSVEFHSSYLLDTKASYQWLQKQLEESSLFSHLDFSQKHLAAGVAHKNGQKFGFVLIGKTNKGKTSKHYIEETLKQVPNALIITIGDTQLDFPMHENAHLAFHVGLKKVWQNNPLSHCVVVRDSKGNDEQHIEGTIAVLKFLEKKIGSSFEDVILSSPKEFNWEEI